MKPREKPTSERLITRRVAAGFGLVSIVAIVMCGVLISLIAQVSDLVHGMQKDETAIKASNTLATSIREQYIHQAHWIIEGDSHLAHYTEIVDRISRETAALENLVPSSERQRLAGVARGSTNLDEAFRELVEKHTTGDRETLLETHHQLEAITTAATADADHIARSVEARMAMDHRSATRSTRIGLLVGGACVFLVLSLAAFFTLRLRRAVLRPLNELVRAANRFGAGDFASRVGEVGEGEFRDVARAFDGMADELEARESQVIRAERMAAIGQLAAGVAHEINNPIGVIRGYLKTMGPESCGETLAEELAILDEEAAACQRIAEDLVAYSRSPDLMEEPTKIAELLRETAKRFGETPEGREHEVVLDLAEATIRVDGPRMRQVILNLLINAAQVAEPKTKIDLRSEGSKHDYRIQVLDRGQGIAEGDHERIFEPFFSKRPGGSGLGLAVCSGIVRAHNGTITASDRPSGGTTMSITLPVGGSS